MADDGIRPKVETSVDLGRRRCVFKIVTLTAGAAAGLYIAPLALRIGDEAEAKGSKRPKPRKGPSRRRMKMPSRRHRRHFPTRR